MKPKPMILNTSDEAARRVTVTGWVDRDGRFYGDDERMARWSGCTHIVCECGNTTEKTWIACETCRAKADKERWEKLELVKWDGETPFCLDDGDEYFFHAESFYDWLEDQDYARAEDVRLVLCEPVQMRTVDTDYWQDDMPEDWDGYLPDAIEVARESINAAINAHPEPLCWRGTKKRIVMPTRSDEALS